MPVILMSLLFIIIPYVAAEGINCHGSAGCDLGWTDASLQSIIDRLDKTSTDQKWGPGEHIVCVNHLCAFTQKWDQDITQPDALQKLKDLK